MTNLAEWERRLLRRQAALEDLAASGQHRIAAYLRDLEERVDDLERDRHRRDEADLERMERGE